MSELHVDVAHAVSDVDGLGRFVPISNHIGLQIGTALEFEIWLLLGAGLVPIHALRIKLFI